MRSAAHAARPPLRVTLLSQRPRVLAALFLMVVALVLGGGGPHAPLASMATQLAALPALFLGIQWLLSERPRLGVAFPLLLAAIAMTIPALQLIPLPPATWQALPGRELLAQTVATAGLGELWLPISLDAENTRRALLTLIPAVAMLLITLSLDERERRLVARAVLAVACVAVLIGAAQIAAPRASAMQFYPTAALTMAIGFFANQNHHAVFLAIAIALVPVAFLSRAERPGGRRMLWIALGLLLVLPVAAVATLSRAGSLLAGFATIAALFMLWRSPDGERKQSPVAIGVSALGLVVLAVIALPPVIDRLTGVGDDLRFGFLPDVMWALGQYFPVGAGVGAFDVVFRSAETLANVRPSYINHAHNDYLEIVLEAGVVGAVGVALFLIWYAIAGWRAWRTKAPRLDSALARTGSLIVLILLTHSLVDYPLRTAALSSLFAFGCGLLVFPPRPVQRQA